MPPLFLVRMGKERSLCVYLYFRDRFDPSRFILEHYVDGDLLDASEPTNDTLAEPDNLHVWGKSLSSVVIFGSWGM